MDYNSSYRIWHTVTVTPQGSRSEPSDFKVKINDLFDTDYLKYADDVIAASVSVETDDTAPQNAADQLFSCMMQRKWDDPGH